TRSTSVGANRSPASGQMSRSDRNCCKRSGDSPVAALSSSADKFGQPGTRHGVFIGFSGGIESTVRLSLSPSGGSRQEVVDRRRVVVEHLRTRQFPLAYLIDAEHRRLQPFARWADGPLLPEDDDLLWTGRHHARIHSPLRLGRL